MLMYRTALAVVLMVGFLGFPRASCGGDAALALLHREYDERHARFAADMEELAAESEQTGSREAAAAIRKLIPPLDEQTSEVDSLPEQVQEELSAAVPDAERRWRGRLRRIREEYAQDLYVLSRKALNAEEVTFSYHLVREVAFHDHDHRLARQLLGYVRDGDRWVTPFEQIMLRKGNVWHDTFGWLPQAHVERYEQGERYFRGRWMSAEEEAEQRRDFNNAWEIESDHFLIKTNQSLERGVELSVALERFHRFFRREFAAVFNSPQQMRQLLSGARGRPPQHEIHYYRSQLEFIQRLRQKQPGIEVSNGLYLPADRTAYFFSNPDDPDGNIETLYHEVTHQLLSESQRNVYQVGQHANFWLIEGIACYLESFEIDEQGVPSVGDPRHVRMQWARERRLKEGFYIPLSQFTRMGSRDFQPTRTANLQLARFDGTLQQLYSQSTGMAHFFMHYDGGRYREALIEHLAQIYSPNPRIRANPEPLDKLTGVSFDILDRQYLSHLTEMQAAIDAGELTGPP